MDYSAGDIVVLKSGYTGHLMKVEVIGDTHLYIKTGNTTRDAGVSGFSSYELDESGKRTGSILSGWNKGWIVRKAFKKEKLKCPHCNVQKCNHCGK